jgi:transcriptional regulator with XRE-family HTH domain
MQPGKKIQNLREEKKMALNDLAQTVKLNNEQLECIENGSVAPSLGVLIKLSRALGVRLGTFLDDQVRSGAVISRNGDEAASISMSNSDAAKNEKLSFFSLAREKADRHMEPFLVEIKPGIPSNPTASTHEGEEFIFVLEGSIKVAYGKEEHLLKTGDSIYLDSIVKHQIYSADNNSAKVLAVVYLPL